MNSINFYVSLHPKVYLKLEKEAQKMHVSKNEFISHVILSFSSFHSADLEGQKNAGIENVYNGLIEQNDYSEKRKDVKNG